MSFFVTLKFISLDLGNGEEELIQVERMNSFSLLKVFYKN